MNLRIKSTTSQIQFERIYRERAAFGEKAELAVIEFEKGRLNRYPEISKRIEHIAHSNIAAGCDVLSFDIYENKNVSSRYIEVKAVSSLDWRFYWSANEIELSKEQRTKYYLYLVPVVGGQPDIDNLEIIRDPYENVYRKENIWGRKIESFSFFNRILDIND